MDYYPIGLTKKLVGEKFKAYIAFTDMYAYEVEFFTNINHVTKKYPMVRDMDGKYKVAIELKESGYYEYEIRFRRRGTSTWKSKKFEGGIKKQELQVDPAWLSQAIIYNVFVRFFTGKVLGEQIVKPGEGGTFDDVKAHLADLKKIGANVLYLNPIHIIGELYRKYNTLDQLPSYLQPGSPYSIKDYKSIDPELTYDKDTKKHLLSDPTQEFKDLINAAHEHGMFVIMDLVFNHTAHDFVFQRIKPEWYLYKENILSITDPYIYEEDLKKGLPWGDPKHTMAPYDHGCFFEDAAQLNWEYMIPPGPNKPPKNRSLPEMWEYFKSIPKYWIRHFGVDGFRCDVAYRVPPAFWKACIAEARKEARSVKNNISHDVMFIAESYTNDLKELQEAGFAAVYGDYSHQLGKANSLRGYLEYIYNINGNFFPKGSKWLIFPESHDFSRSPSKVLGENIDPFKAVLANKSRWLLTATLPGIPLIFNGFEKVEWKPINLFSYGAVDWEKEEDIREFLEKVNSIRHRHTALYKGKFKFLETNQGNDDKTQILSYSRKSKNETIIVVINMDVNNTAGPAIIYLPEEFSGSYRLEDLLSGEAYNREGRELMVVLEPGQGHIFRVC